MKSFSGTILLTIPLLANSAYYLEDEVPQKITAQLAVVETSYKPQPAYTYNVPFYAQKYQLGPTAILAIKNLIPDLQKSKSITVQGRPDANGQNDTDLARRRALAIKKYLVSNGIPESRIDLSVEKEIRFDVNPEVFNSTIFTGESLPELPKKVKSSFYSDTGTTHNQTAPQVAAPVPLKSVQAVQQPQISVNPSQQTSAEKMAKVEGTFKVLSQEQPIEKQSFSVATTTPSTLDFSNDASLNSESRTSLARFATSTKVSSVMADGSMAGFKKAKELSGFIQEVTGSRPEVKAKGAPKGFVIVKG